MSRGLVDPPVARPRRIWEEQLGSTDHPTEARRDDQRFGDPPVSVNGAKSIRRKSSVQRTIVSKFDDCLTSEVAESSRHSNHIRVSKDMIEKLVAVPSSVTLSIFVFVLFFKILLLLLFYSDQVGTSFASGGLPHVL